MASSRSLAVGSANAISRMRARSSAPSAVIIASPNAARMAGMAAPPAAVRLRALASASISAAPWATSMAAKVLLPLPMPPVSPIFFIGGINSAQGERKGEGHDVAPFIRPDDEAHQAGPRQERAECDGDVLV